MSAASRAAFTSRSVVSHGQYVAFQMALAAIGIGPGQFRAIAEYTLHDRGIASDRIYPNPFGIVADRPVSAARSTAMS